MTTAVPVQSLNSNAMYALILKAMKGPNKLECPLCWRAGLMKDMLDVMCRPSMRHQSKEAREKAMELCKAIHQAQSDLAIHLSSCNHNSYNSQVLEKHLSKVHIEARDLCDLIGFSEFSEVLCAGI